MKKNGFGGGGGFGGNKGFGGGAKKRSIPYRNPHKSAFEGLEEPTGDLQKDSAAEIDAVARAFRERKAKEKERFDLAVDASFWSGVCFHTEKDRRKFLIATGITRLYNGQHIDGYELCKALGLDIDWEE